MMRVNHSCQPNVGMGGNILLVSMRDIAAGEELTIDYALFLGDPGFAMECRCGSASASIGEVVKSGSLRLRARAAAAPAAAVSTETPASLRQRGRPWLGRLEPPRGRRQQSQTFGRDAVLQDPPRALDPRRRPGTRPVHAAPVAALRIYAQ